MLTRMMIGALTLSLVTLVQPGGENVTGSVVESGVQKIDSRAAFKRLERLVGTWKYTVDGRPGSQLATYRITGRNVLVEDMGGMMTTYHLDGDKLVLTHYCGAGNQPRMRMKEADEKHIAFEMYDITNLAHPNAYHSTHLNVAFLSDDSAELTFRGTSDGEQSTQVFKLTRQSR